MPSTRALVLLVLLLQGPLARGLKTSQDGQGSDRASESIQGGSRAKEKTSKCRTESSRHAGACKFQAGLNAIRHASSSGEAVLAAGCRHPDLMQAAVAKPTSGPCPP